MTELLERKNPKLRPCEGKKSTRSSDDMRDASRLRQRCAGANLGVVVAQKRLFAGTLACANRAYLAVNDAVLYTALLARSLCVTIAREGDDGSTP